MSYLLFDIGGTRTRLAVSRDKLSFDEPIFIETPQDFNQAIEILGEKALEICGGKIEKAVGGIAGSLDREKTGVYRAPNLIYWEQKNFVEEFGKKIKASVKIENDTAMVGLGEAVAGAGKIYNLIVYITVSTGVNGAKISNKQIDENVFGFEIGHQIVDMSTHLDMTTNKGELEDFISGRETEKRLGVKADEITDEKEWRKIAEWTAVGIYNSVLHWSPDVVVLGGSMMDKIPIEVIKDKLHNLVSEIYPESPEVVRAELGAIGGIHGALHYLQNNS